MTYTKAVSIVLCLLLMTGLGNALAGDKSAKVDQAYMGPSEEMGFCTKDNPAAVYCMDLGYKCISTADDANCIFPDGSKCEIWHFFRGTCGQKFSYCETQSKDNTVVRRVDDMGSWCAEYAVCVFPEGFECAEYDYYKDQCKPGECQSWILSKGGCVNCSKSK